MTELQNTFQLEIESLKQEIHELIRQNKKLYTRNKTLYRANLRLKKDNKHLKEQNIERDICERSTKAGGEEDEWDKIEDLE